MNPHHFAPMAALALVACATTDSEPAPIAPPQAATGYAQLLDASGNAKARAVLTDAQGGTDVGLVVDGLAPGTYAFHIHATGTCTPPDFTSAGPHFNPTGVKHGGHKGDLPNVTVGADGKARVETRIEGVSLAGGDTPIIDPDGAAVVIHAQPDDGVTDPAGNAGARIACGAIVTK